ncbi:hypothetical protein [Haloarchaeobius sp. HME9146]|uniref:hypothetical protein n=1 Tax=Haloarchaeobius sp. HME9146 TaxID=2978732 RepID=UPI0021C0FEEC|nr:hypothetical protein [Haloarchaeobius sp. HME9146]MCT9097935.1 hypothetical protein [Haloarchaeobius sp. HME9146]
MLRSLSAAGLTTAVSPVAAGSSGGEQTVWSFEDDLDGWQTNGSNSLVRVSNEEFSGIVTGSHGLGVTTDGDPYPMIENKTRLSEVDLVESSYLSVDVLPIVFGSDSDVVFQFVLHATPEETGENGRSRNGDSTEKGKNGSQGKRSDGSSDSAGRPRSVSSPELRVEQYSASTLGWDLESYPTWVRRNATRLEIRWHPADYEPRGTPRGNGPATSDYDGFTVFDRVQVTDDVATVEQSQAANDLTRLRADRGRVTAVETSERTEDYEAGEFNFADGTTVPYEFERLDRSKYRLTVDGTAYRLGGGWK